MTTETLAISVHYPNHSFPSVSFKSSTMTNFPRQSGTVSTATADVKPIVYAAKGDWVKHCTLIAQLYEERSLAEVMDVMEKQHGCRAT